MHDLPPTSGAAGNSAPSPTEVPARTRGVGFRIAFLGAGIALATLGICGLLTQVDPGALEQRPIGDRAALSIGLELGKIAQPLTAVQLTQAFTQNVTREEVGELLTGGTVRGTVDVELTYPRDVYFPSTFLVEAVLSVHVEEIDLSRTRLAQERREVMRATAQDILQAVRRNVSESELSEALLQSLPRFELVLAGATVSPSTPIKAGAGGRLTWSVCPERAQAYNGLVRPFNAVKEQSFEFATWWPAGTDRQLSFQAKEKPQSPIKRIWAIALALGGTAMSIPGLLTLWETMLAIQEKRKKNRVPTTHQSTRSKTRAKK